MSPDRRDKLIGRHARTAFRRGAVLWSVLALAFLLSACATARPAVSEVISYDGPPPPDARLRLGKGTITVMAFSPDGEYLAVGSNVGLYLYRTGTFEEVWLVPGNRPVSSLAFSADGSLLAAGLESGALILLDAATGDILTTLQGTAEVGSLAWSSAGLEDEGVLLAAGFNDGQVIVSNVRRADDEVTVDVVGALERHSSGVSSLAYSPDGRILATGSRSGFVSLWNARTGQLLQTFAGHEIGQAVLALDWLPDGGTLISGSRDHQVIVWDIRAGQQARTLAGHEGGVLSVGHSPDGASVVSASDDGTVIVWNAEVTEPVRTLEGLSTETDAVAWSPDGVTFVAASRGGTLRMWNLGPDGPDGELLQEVEGFTARSRSVRG
ncbi:MAG TPA: WD40 repeat domain-containing protein, partial [Chloroflexi bacterium]|nr:WD40 repeat domain-containing protein [Chloroflexota bacterium]